MILEEWQTEVKGDTAAQYKVLKELMHDARVDSVVCATDENKKGETQHKLHLPVGHYSVLFRRLFLRTPCR